MNLKLNINLINLTLFSPCNIVMLFITMTNNYCTKFINTLMSLNPTRVSVPGGPSSGVTVVEFASLLSLHVVIVSSGTLHFALCNHSGMHCVVVVGCYMLCFGFFTFIFNSNNSLLTVLPFHYIST